MYHVTLQLLLIDRVDGILKGQTPTSEHRDTYRCAIFDGLASFPIGVSQDVCHSAGPSGLLVCCVEELQAVGNGPVLQCG